MLSKLALGQDLVTDLAFVSGSSDDWWIVLIELESPRAKFFRGGTGKPEFHGDFRKGLDQINRWRAWLSIPTNAAHLYEHALRPLVASHIDRKVLFKFVLVTGRRGEYGGNRTLQDLVASQERDDFAIMSWDALLEYPDMHDPLYVGKRRDGYIDIVTKEFLHDDLFPWIDCKGIRLNPELREACGPFVVDPGAKPFIRNMGVAAINKQDLDAIATW